MQFANVVSGGAARIDRYQTAATVIEGVPMLVKATATAGLAQATTTGAQNCVGVSIDAATYTTTQSAAGTEALVSVASHPNMIFRARMSGSASAGAVLSSQTVTTASANGTAVTTGASWSSPTFLDGTVWGYSGANTGSKAKRAITAVSATAGTVLVPFDVAIAVGDVFLRVPYSVFGTSTAQLTTNLVEVDASIAVGTGANFRCVGLELLDLSGDGTRQSYVHLRPTSTAY